MITNDYINIKDFSSFPIDSDCKSYAIVALHLIHRRLHALTIDIIAATAFGLEVNGQTTPNSPFVSKALALVDGFELGKGVFHMIKLVLTIVATGR